MIRGVSDKRRNAIGCDSWARLGLALPPPLSVSVLFGLIAVVGAWVIGRARLVAAFESRRLLISVLAIVVVLGPLNLFGGDWITTEEKFGPMGLSSVVVAPPAFVAAFAIATSRNKMAMTAFIVPASAIWTQFLAFAGFAPSPPTPNFATIIWEHQPLRNDMALLVWRLLVIALTRAGASIGRRLR